MKKIVLNNKLAIENKLQQTECFLKNLLAILPEQIYWMDREGRIINCNEQQAKVFGLASSDDLIGKNIYDVAEILGWDKSIPDTIHTNDLLVMKSKQPLISEETILVNNKERIFMVHKNPLLDENNKVIGIVGISIDITERKRAEKLQLEANKLLVEKDASDKLAKAMEMVSGFIAHEMKTPLAIVNLNNDLLSLDLKNEELDLNSPDAKERINNYHDNIQFAVYSADNIIGMLLTKLSNLKSVRLGPADYEFTPIKQTIDAAVKQYPFLKYEKPLMHWNPKANEDFKYFGRDDLTKNILFNLIRNALRAIKEYDKGEIFITLASDEKFNYLIFKDTGMGIPESHLANLFQQFNTHTSGGSGLGLAFCKMVMNSYGGDITCKSKEREFTEFTLSFPKDGGTNTTLKQKITARQAK